MPKKNQVTFKIDNNHIEDIDNFIKQAGLSRSKFIEHVVKSAAESIRSVNSTWTACEYDEESGMEVQRKKRGEPDMQSARDIIDAIFKINQAIGESDDE